MKCVPQNFQLHEMGLSICTIIVFYVIWLSSIIPCAQVIAFVEALLRSESTNISKIAIIVPVNTLENWKNELLKWIPEDKLPRVN